MTLFKNLVAFYTPETDFRPPTTTTQLAVVGEGHTPFIQSSSSSPNSLDIIRYQSSHVTLAFGEEKHIKAHKVNSNFMK